MREVDQFHTVKLEPYAEAVHACLYASHADFPALYFDLRAQTPLLAEELRKLVERQDYCLSLMQLPVPALSALNGIVQPFQEAYKAKDWPKEAREDRFLVAIRAVSKLKDAVRETRQEVRRKRLDLGK